MKYYIGALPDEVFVGNTPTEGGVPAHLRSLATARLGDKALDLEGKCIDPDYMRPLFIGRIEIYAYDKIMLRRVSHWQFPGRRKGEKL